MSKTHRKGISLSFLSDPLHLGIGPGTSPWLPCMLVFLNYIIGREGRIDRNRLAKNLLAPVFLTKDFTGDEVGIFPVPGKHLD